MEQINVKYFFVCSRIFVNKMMKKKFSLLVLNLLMLTGCYPGWQDVRVKQSVENESCEYKGIEACKGGGGKCSDYLKKRAIKLSSNTLTIESDSDYTLSKNYNCKPGLPPYKKLTYTKVGYMDGNNTVTGQAFLTQRDGGVVTCAGRSVIIYPNVAYFLVARDGLQDVQFNKELSALKQGTQCDAQGNFEFEGIANGEWIIETSVSWEVAKVGYIGAYSIPSIYSFGYYYRYNDKQGGFMRKRVSVSNDYKNRFILSKYK